MTQGELVAQLWPLLFEKHHLEIAFAHRTFAWGSDARGKAHVHVVIIGLAKHAEEPPTKRLFSYDDINGEPTESKHAALTPYLFDAGTVNDPHLVVREVSRPLTELPRLISGTQPIDGGYYIFNQDEYDEFVHNEPLAANYLRPFVGSEEYINGRKAIYLKPSNGCSFHSACNAVGSGENAQGARVPIEEPTKKHASNRILS